MTAPRFYDGTPGRELGVCRDCGRPCDAAFGDHFGICTDRMPIVRKTRKRSGAEVIREYALIHQFFSINNLRPLMEREGIAPSRRGPAFTTACDNGWIERVGHEPSTSGPTKGHDIKRYRSCVGQWARELQEAR